MNSVEQAIKALYGAGTYGELASLYKLFDKTVCDALEIELGNALKLRKEPERQFYEDIYVDFQWIDKIPLASFVSEQKDINGHKIENKTELGDLFIQYRHSHVFTKDGSEEVSTRLHRSLVVQAKIAEKENPEVPIGYVNKQRANSTSKELKLLESWPTFDMYETANSSKPLAENLSVKVSGSPFSFYGGFFNKNKQWFFGKAKNGEICKKSFFDIVLALAQGKAGKDVSNDPAWKIVTGEITKTCKNREMPKSIAKKVESRHKSKKIGEGILYSIPTQFIHIFRRMVEKIISTFRRRRMLILTIDRVSREE